MEERVKRILREYIGSEKEYDVFIVWKCKILQHSKWLLGTTLPDNKYYELTYNGINDELYIDEYDKKNNVMMSNPFCNENKVQTQRSETYLDRMKNELSELKVKYDKLENYLLYNTEKFSLISDQDRGLLIRQHKSMEDYMFVLEARIDLAEKAQSKKQ